MAADINLDTSTGITFVAEGSTVRQQLRAMVAGQSMLMTSTGEKEFLRLVAAYGGPLEQARALRFLARVQIIPDQPSSRALTLTPTRALEWNDIVIFGTGDERGIVTVTGDRRAVSAARSQGVNFQVSLHRSVTLTGV